MDQYITWTNTSHGPIHHMDQYITWTNISHGPIHHMDQYITWTNTSHGPIHYMDQYITWTNTLHGPITRLVLHVYTMDTCSILGCKWYDSLIHLFQNSTVCLLNSWVSGQCYHAISTSNCIHMYLHIDKTLEMRLCLVTLTLAAWESIQLYRLWWFLVLIWNSLSGQSIKI